MQKTTRPFKAKQKPKPTLSRKRKINPQPNTASRYPKKKLISENYSEERIQKVLANAGLGSRRQIEEWIKLGRISIDGSPAKLGEKVNLLSTIKLDGRIVDLKKSLNTRTRVLIYHKPEGEICSRNDPEGRPTIFDRLPLLRNSRWISIGRLDFNTSGILLLTNNGDMANKLMHPSANIEREYAVRVLGQVAPQVLKNLRAGVKLEDGLAKFESIKEGGGERSNHWYHVIVKEGRNRIVRRLWESQGIKVTRLIRVRFGNISLPRQIRRGRWEEMEKQEITKLLSNIPGNF